MRPLGGGRGEHLLAALTRLYGALLVLYPKPFRRRYEAEMRRDFRELMLEGLPEGGATEMVRVLALAFSDLVLTALMERGTRLLRGAYLPVAPGTAARWGALSALLGGSLGVAFSLASYTWAISAQLDWLLSGWVYAPVLMCATLLCVLGTFGLYGTLVARSGRPDALALSGATLAALSAVSFLALYAYTIAEMLGWLWTPGEVMSWWEMNRGVLLQEVGTGAYALGLLLLGVSAFRARLFGRLLPCRWPSPRCAVPCWGWRLAPVFSHC